MLRPELAAGVRPLWNLKKILCESYAGLTKKGLAKLRLTLYQGG